MPYRRLATVSLPFVLVLGVSACSDREPELETIDVPAPPAAGAPESDPDSDPGPDAEPGLGSGPAEGPNGGAEGTVHEYAYLESQVHFVMGFLRGESSLPPDMLADSVTLRVAPEGGGDVARFSRKDLQDRDAWRVGAHTLIPPTGLGHVRMTPGLHGSCAPAGLETLYPDLAALPHVGVRLAPDDLGSCLQTWSATFVFDGDAESPRLIAVVYDQWEW